ncbi:MAG: TorF family putative porin [Pseudomonas sp.]|uniref:TorF family putative porin n=1 Tax=Pseudomonas sp. TaxID=306 RepID=UPI0030F0B69E
MGKIGLGLGAGLLYCLTFPAQAVELNEDFSLNLTLTALSDYRTGGISQTLGDPALWTDVSLVHSSGLYAGVFTSNVDFGTDTRREYDYYVGIAHDFTDDINATLTYYAYDYPKDSEFNYGEWIGTLGAYGATLGVKYTNEVKPYDDDRSVVWLGYAFNLPYETTLDVRYGVNDAKDDIWVSRDESARSRYYDWEVGVSKELFGFNWRVAYIDTDLSQAECASVNGYDDVCSATVIAQVAKTF